MNRGWDNAYQDSPYHEVDPHPGVVRLVEDGYIRPGDLILDLGCGDGRHLVFLEKAGCRAYGIDPALWGIRRARTWLEAEGSTPRVVCGEAAGLPYPSGAFQAVISIQVIHHQRLTGIKRSLAEVARVLASDGLFYFNVPRSPPGDWVGGAYTEIEPGTFTPTAGFETGIPHHFFKEDELVDALAEFRFRALEMEDSLRRHLSVLARKK